VAEHHRVLERLVLAFGHRQGDDVRLLPEIVDAGQTRLPTFSMKR
jgi:hypothetical protein